jgi:exodeoxyribonuclease V gamma subunit
LLRIYHSNQLDILKDLVSYFIKQAPLNNPFDEEKILVQSPGMAQWLKLSLADELGIAANIEFPLPASFIWKMFVNTLEDIPERSAFNKEGMAWKIMKSLPELLDQDDFSPLKQYLQNDDKQHKAYQLSNKIADIFDQYLVYRPQWIEDWEKDGSLGVVNQHSWQPILWRALVNETHRLGQSPWHRANLYDSFIEKLKTSSTPKGLPSRIFVFGVSALPPRYLHALHAIGRHIDVHFMLSNPCRYYWGDIVDQKWLAKLNARQRKITNKRTGFSLGESSNSCIKQGSFFDDDGTLAQGNPLLASMGKLGRDNLFLLSDMNTIEIDAFEPIEGSSLLKQIQKDIFDLNDSSVLPKASITSGTSEHKIIAEKNDDSISLHLCHSPMREVEVLHDQILTMLKNDSSLTPKDIVVMMPDVNAYSPYITTIFGSASREHYIPFSISDRSAQEENPLINSFLQLLQLPLSRFKQSDLMGLIEVPEILARFNLTADELPLIAKWIEESGIRWGLDDEDKYRFDLNVMPENTWLSGLKRLLLGYSMVSDEPYGGLLPYDAMSPSNAECLGKLAHFVETLQNTLHKMQLSHSLTDWLVIINQLLVDMYEVDTDGEFVLKLIRDGLQSLQNQIEDSGFDLPINNELLHSYLSNRLQSQRSSQRFLAGQLNFCTLMPMRSIPFKVVCLLGMNDDVYPRSIAPLGFDLMNVAIKKGDRSRRDDDRYLFLEALVSAQKSLYISYTGFDIKDNSEKQPSVLVTELLEYIGASRVLANDTTLESEASAKKMIAALSCHHHLQAFNRSYYQKSSKLTSFSTQWLPALNNDKIIIENKFFEQELNPIDFSQQQEIELDSLKRFMINPSSYFMRQRLKINLYKDDSVLHDEEPFMLDGLENYILKDQLLSAWIKNGETKQLTQKLSSAGRLPQGFFGEILLGDKNNEMQNLAITMQDFKEQAIENIDVNINFTINNQNVRVVGWLNENYQQGLFRFKPTKFSAKDYLKNWIDFLCYCIQIEDPLPMNLLDEENHYQFSPLTREEAMDHLQFMVTCYINGLNKPLCFFVKSAWTYQEKLSGLSSDDTVSAEEIAFEEAQKTFGGGYAFMGEAEDPYIQRCFEDLDEVSEEFKRLSTTIFEPTIKHLISSNKADESPKSAAKKVNS